MSAATKGRPWRCATGWPPFPASSSTAAWLWWGTSRNLCCDGSWRRREGPRPSRGRASMDPALFSTSTVAAFLGGMIALAAPCCVTFLLPAYLASAFRARTALLAMTLVFALGVAAVLLPITLGVAALSRLVDQVTGEVFLIGGV